MGWPTSEPGGLNRYLADLAEHLSPAAVLTVSPAPSTPDGVVTAARPSAPLPARLRAVWEQTARIIERERPDLVNGHFPLYTLPVILGPGRDLPLVVHFHGPWADEGAVEGAPSWRTAAKRLVERLVYRRADKFIVLSRAFRRLLVEDYRVPPWDVEVIAPGVDLDRFRTGDDRTPLRERRGIDADTQLVLCVRRLVPRMGLDVLLDAWQTVGDDGRLLVIAGEGPEQQPLRERAVEHGIQDTVRFLGRIDDDDLADWYRAADLTVVPSVVFEGFGLVVLESLASGTPVVGTDVGGLTETLTRVEGPAPVPAGDREVLADTLGESLDDRATLPDRRTCRSFAEQYAWPSVVDEVQRVFDRAVSGRPRRNLRVVYLDHTARLSGAELSLVRLLPALESIDAHVILGEDGPLMQRLEQAGASVEVLPLPRRTRELSRHRALPAAPLHAPAVAAYGVRLVARLRRYRPDLVHTNSLKAGIYGTVAARLARIPAVWHLHDRLASDYLPESTAKWMRRAVRLMPDAVIANSETTLGTLQQRAKPGHVVPYAIPSPDLQGASSPEGTFTVGMVGRLAHWKGQDVLLRAFAEAFPQGDQSLRIVGSAMFGEDDYESELHSLVGHLGLRDRVVFAGFREDVQAELADFDVLVHASRIPEPFGQVVVEGMAAGLPVVATDAGGPAEIITDRIDGLLCGPGDIDELAGHLRRLHDNPQARRNLARAAIETATEYRPPIVAGQVLEVYREVLS